MVTPTRAEIETQFSNAIHILEETREFGHVDATNLLGLIDTLEQSFKGDFISEASSAAGALRARYASVLESSFAASFLRPHLRQYGKFVNAPETDDQTILTRLRDDFIANTQRVQSRVFVFGSPAAGGGNVGDGVINRLFVDEDNQQIENTHSEAKVATIVSDEHSGADEHEEFFEFLGDSPERDQILISGSGAFRRVKSISARDSENFIGNPSFSRFDGTLAVPTAITDWTVSDIANVQLDQTNFYRGFLGDVTPTALQFETNASVEQNLSVRGVQLDPNVPMYCQVAYNRAVGSGDGTLTLTMGGVTASVALVAQAGWNILRIAIGQNNWFKTFNQEDPLIKVELTGRTTGTTLIDDVIFVPFENFDGIWYAPVGGQTPFLRDDTFTWTDTETGSVIQLWIWRSFGRYLPHGVGGAITWADP